MISFATIIEEMTNDMVRSNDFMQTEYEKYLELAEERKPVYENIYNAFVDDMFGEFSNRIKREEFNESLAKDGYKWFDMKGLNKVFMEEAKKHALENQN